MRTSVEILRCGRDDLLWDDYFLLLMRNYPDLGLPYPFDMTLSFVGNPICAGDALIARNAKSGETVGALGFVFGTGADEYTDRSVCQVEALYVKPGWRQTAVPALLLLHFADYLEQCRPGIERIQFWSPADLPALDRLFRKFSEGIKTSEKSFGRIRLYETDVHRIAAYAQPFRLWRG